MQTLKIKCLRDVPLPSYSREGDCAIDLRASGVWIIGLDSDRREITQEEYTVQPGERIIVESGIAIELPTGHFGSTRDRSGMAGNYGLHVLGGVLDENSFSRRGTPLRRVRRRPARAGQPC